MFYHTHSFGEMQFSQAVFWSKVIGEYSIIWIVIIYPCANISGVSDNENAPVGANCRYKVSILFYLAVRQQAVNF